MAYHKILSKVDQAIQAYLISEGIGTTDSIVCRKRADDVPPPPYVGIRSGPAAETTPFSANFRVTVVVEVHTNATLDYQADAEELREASDDLVSETFDLFYDQYTDDGGKLADAITAAAAGLDVTIQSVRVTGIDQDEGQKEGEWIDIINLEVVCHPST